ncbi:hypothetical protein GQ54DRAFT_205801 [Martensiomyces pterosporus]|nr:hypothetical protein GQ54DRAFT_205801 [Martensiomyces pterosporus]
MFFAFPTVSTHHTTVYEPGRFLLLRAFSTHSAHAQHIRYTILFCLCVKNDKFPRLVAGGALLGLGHHPQLLLPFARVCVCACACVSVGGERCEQGRIGYEHGPALGCMTIDAIDAAAFCRYSEQQKLAGEEIS